MAKIKGICKNIDGCDLAADKVIQEADSFDFKCQECGKELYPLEEKKKRKKSNHLITAITVAVVVLVAILGSVIAFSGESSDDQQNLSPITDTIATIDSTETIVPIKKDTVVVTDTVVQRDTIKVEVASKTKPIESKPKPVAAYSSKDLGYATFKGSWPNDVNGRMIFNSSHVIDSKDPKKRVAEAGDYVIGEWSDGHLVQGIWYGSDNRVKGSIIIGK